MAMTPEERMDLIAKIDAKMKDMTDEDLMALANENDVHVESAAEKIPEGGSVVVPPIIDTGILTGPVNGLKNFLIKKQRDNDSKS